MARESTFSDEEVMAFADGQAEPDLANLLAAAVISDPTLARRVALFKDTRERAKQAFAIAPGQGGNRALEALIRRASPAQSPPVAANDNRRRSALAASIAAVVAGLAGYVFGVSGGTDPSMGKVQLAGLEGHLSVAASGVVLEVDHKRVEMIATFKNANGNACREFEVADPAGPDFVSVACRRDGQWQVTFMAGTPEVGQGFVPAGGREALEAYLAGAGAGEPMTGPEEKDFLATVK
jgi:hypothetical protein